MPTLLFELLQGAAVVLGMMGAVLVTAQSEGTRRVGFGCWILGNLLWIITGLVEKNVYLTVMFGFYWLTSMHGWKNNKDQLPS